MKDDNGIDVMHGDTVCFAFGLPPREARQKGQDWLAGNMP